LLVIEVGVLHFKGKVVFETTNIEGLRISCHWNVSFASDVSNVVRVQVGVLQKNLVDQVVVFVFVIEVLLGVFLDIVE
jgi:hypothetical protein